MESANLLGATLNGTYASFANFSSARICNASICYSILHVANFYHSDLEGADLRDSDLRDADFRGANLRSANLGLVKFLRTKLDEADMSDAAMGATTLADVDLGRVQGLDKIAHSGPSSIGVDTLYRSRGAIPDIFLRGAGLDERFLAYFSSIAQPMAIDFYSCFISYTHPQKSFARRIYAELQARGIRCWLDEHQLLPGDEIYDAIDRGIRLWDKVLLCCSQESLGSWWVNDEIDKALEKERELQRERGTKVLAIIPLNLDNFVLEGWKDGRAATLRKRVVANFVGWENDNKIFEVAFESVVRALQSGDNARPTPPDSKL